MQGQPELQKNALSEELNQIQIGMSKLVTGQDNVILRVVHSLARCIAGLNDPERPLLNMIFLGPTGVGKTETVRALAETIFGNRRAFTRVSCQEYSAHYNISKLLGSPPGYVGGEIRPLLSQENLDRHHRKALDNNNGLISQADSKLAKMFLPDSEKYLSIILFDEIEKAHPKLWNLLLGVMDDAEVVLGNNEVVDFRNSIIIFTSNVGSKAMSEKLGGRSMGFQTVSPINILREDLHKMAIIEAEKLFPAEFLNRMDDILTYNALSHKDLLDICNILIRRAISRVFSSRSNFLLEFREDAKEHLVNKLGGTRKWGARPLKRLLEIEIITPISHYVCNDQINQGDLVTVGVAENGEDFSFNIEAGLTRVNDSAISTIDSYPADRRKVNDDTGAAEKIKGGEEVTCVADQET